MFKSAKKWCQEVLQGEPAPVKAAVPIAAEPSGSTAMRFLPAGALDALRSPGAGVKTVVAEPVIVVPVAAPVSKAVERIETAEDRLRVDLPPRDAEQIARLIAAGESESQREARIKNDKDRWRYQQGL